MRIYLVTGMSGAGKSLALRVLEDHGVEAVDNVPLSLLGMLVHGSGGDTMPDSLAVGVDVRSRGFSYEKLRQVVEMLRGDPGVDARLIFLDCDDEALLRRFKETRRSHPLAPDRPVSDGITQERQMLLPVRILADIVLDTTDYRPADLRRALVQALTPPGGEMTLLVESFSYRHGLPRDADIVLDMRFLKNPHYEEALRPSSGLTPEVGAYIEADPAWAEFLASWQALFLPQLPRFLADGKRHVTLAVGCTGGWHRSVFTAEQLAGILRKRGYKVEVEHRDMHHQHA